MHLYTFQHTNENLTGSKIFFFIFVYEGMYRYFFFIVDALNINRREITYSFFSISLAPFFMFFSCIPNTFLFPSCPAPPTLTFPPISLCAQVLVLVGGDCVDEDFARREPNLCLWVARRFLSGPGLIRNVEWRPLAQLPDPPRFRHCACVLQNKLYVIGGRKYYGSLDILKSAVRCVGGPCFWRSKKRTECSTFDISHFTRLIHPIYILNRVSIGTVKYKSKHNLCTVFGPHFLSLSLCI